MLTRWIPVNQESKIPFYASHYIGVGGLVLNKDKSKILAIQEKKSHFKRLWKIPGGAVDPDESIQQAAVREVWEETGVRVKFKSVLAFRELKKYRFGQGDIYFICLMEPISDELEPKIDIQMKDEIKAAKWMIIDDLKHLGFTKSIQNLCGVLRKLENHDDV